MMTNVHPFILSGGSGSRLWPLSRTSHPKQFLKLFGEESLLQLTCNRFSSSIFERPSILGATDHKFLIAEQLTEIGVQVEHIVLEPARRNTAPAAITAAILVERMSETSDEELVLLCPSDHLISENDYFISAVQQAIPLASEGHIVTFGVTPDCPHTGYGYIEVGSDQSEQNNVLQFVEKPTIDLARDYLERGNFYWNSGIFLFSAKSIIAQFEQHAPEILEACRNAVESSEECGTYISLDDKAYRSSPDISLDYAIMEKASDVRCIALQAEWSDLGSWSSVWEIYNKDAQGNVTEGDVQLVNVNNSYAYSPDKHLSLVGVDNVLVVVTKDAILVCSKDQSEKIKDVVKSLKQSGRSEADLHNRVYRPWGWFEGLGKGKRSQVKCIMVKPGEQLSLQSHYHRAEHWVVTDGTVLVTKDDTEMLLTENQSTYIPLGAKHRLENPGKVPAYLIEVQSGAYVGEDDIVRYEDRYDRSSTD